MGRDKASLPFNGSTLLQTVIGYVQPLFSQTLVSVRQPRADVSLPQICDLQTGGGPLVGLISVLQEVKTPWAFVVACDMPFVSQKVIELMSTLRGNHQAVIPNAGGHVQPLAAFYACSILSLLQQSLDDGNKSLIGAVKTLDVRYVTADELLQCDPQQRSFFDLDTLQDLALAEGMK